MQRQLEKYNLQPNNNMLPFGIVLTITSIMVIASSVESFVFDSCERTNLTKQECVGKVIMDTLSKANEDPANFFKFNELDNGSGILRLIKLKFDDNSTSGVRRFQLKEEETRSSKNGDFWDLFMSVIEKLTHYSSDHGVLVSLPQWSREFPPVAVVNEDDIFQVVNESRGKHKKFALLFPLLATFKFLVIKALLVPILITVMIIKKMLVLGVMALPTLLTMLRFCRNPNFGGFGLGNLMATGAVGPVGQTAAFAPLAAADMSGDYSNYVQQATAASHHPNGFKDYSKNLLDAMKGTY
ncbi:uncharacterized protein LOC126835350 isoform X2 [Adelges cooleyi]|uniref:uncharacterized protein LOC126835350 isoform X2 n=1 Tax=Adelges cooleyi TaxID=133065 RepID=UPI00217FCC9E|nr:uncharacterized protein LOC126835350 isoform X2 [Adelges cooleyi]